MPWTVDGKKVQSNLQFKTQAQVLALTGTYVGETYYVTDIGEDPQGVLTVWDGTEWIGFLRSNRLVDL